MCMANSVDPDQTPRSVASDLGLHCLLIVKLGFTGVYIIFLIYAQKHILLYSLEPPRRGGSDEYPQSMF